MALQNSDFLAEQLALVAGYRLEPEAEQPVADPKPPARPALAPAAAVELDRARHFVRQGDLIEARIAAERAAVHAPDSPDTRALLGVLLLENGDAVAAGEHLDAAAALAPHWAEAARLCGEAASAVGNLQAARDHFSRALVLRPDWAAANLRLGETLIKAGDFAEGFPRLTARFAARNQLPPAAAWDGKEPLWNKTVVIVPEREIGDLVQFVRYADALKKRGATVYVVCPGDLKNLIESVPGVERAIPAGDEVPPHDYVIPLLDLPGLFETTLGTVPADVPYITTEGRFVAAWRAYFQSLTPNARLRVGLVWADAGEPAAVPIRSVPLVDLEILWQVPDVGWFALQQGPPQAELKYSDTPLIDLSGQLNGADAVLSAVSALDLLIAVDTPATHVKGALGQPTWAMLASACDWRWLGRGETTPWYPSVRLFRQDQPGEWQPVARRVARALAEVLATS